MSDWFVLSVQEKKAFKENCIKFGIGSFLLMCCLIYLANHPAEKVTLLSGFSVMVERAHVIWYQITGRNSLMLNEKYKLEKFYKEMMRTIQDAQCFDQFSYDLIDKKYQQLVNTSLEDFAVYQAEFNNFAYERDQKIEAQCMRRSGNK